MWEIPGPQCGEEKPRYLNQVFRKSASSPVPCFLFGPSALGWFFFSFFIYYDPAMNPHCMSTPCLKDFILQTPELHKCLNFKKLYSSRYLVIATENVLKQSCYLWLSILAVHLKHRQSFKRIQVFSFRHRLRELRFPEYILGIWLFKKLCFWPGSILSACLCISHLHLCWGLYAITSDLSTVSPPPLAHPTC